jgi:enamine deaminase RidA (YjgF/YER057c/UK114 family)
MATPIVKTLKSATISTTWVGKDQLHISAAVTDPHINHVEACSQIYKEISDTLHQNEMHIVHERLFGSLSVKDEVIRGRRESLHNGDTADELPMTYIQGHPYWGEGFSGVQIRAVSEGGLVKKIWTLRENGRPVGRGWIRNGAKFIMLQDIHGAAAGDGVNPSRTEQAREMFDRTNRLLKEEGASFRNVVRTWIYLSKILEWYGDFNTVRNNRFLDYGLFQNPETEREMAEQIYMPASTGIEGDNPAGSAGTMDVFAVIPSDGHTVEIEPVTGKKQKSAYRYGSAFSRAMRITETDCTHILVSGTASIDEKGDTVFLGDTRAQMQKTIEIVNALIQTRGATLANICDATVFLKDAKDIAIWREVSKAKGLDKMPQVCMVADVCRDDLLFELDANVALQHQDLSK